MAYTMGCRPSGWFCLWNNQRRRSLLRARQCELDSYFPCVQLTRQVQLATQHTASFPCPVQANGTQSVASQIVTAIAKIETNYQMELGDVYDGLGDKAFRA